MAQDPAFLFYYKAWLVSTAGWDADIRGWYINLLAHQADKQQGLPQDLEILAELAGVKFSQFDRFKLCWKHTLEAKFITNEEGLLINEKQDETLKERREFKNKQQKRGLVGAFVKKARAKYSLTQEQWQILSHDMVSSVLSLNSPEEIQQCLKRMLEAFIGNANGNGNTNTKGNTEKNGHPVDPPPSGGQIAPIIPQMCQIWYDTIPGYTKHQGNDYEHMGRILRFICDQHNVTDFQETDSEIMILNTIQLLADHVGANTFWKLKALKSIAGHIQEFYNKIKNPEEDGKRKNRKSASNSGASRERIDELLAERFDKQKQHSTGGGTA